MRCLIFCLCFKALSGYLTAFRRFDQHSSLLKPSVHSSAPHRPRAIALPLDTNFTHLTNFMKVLKSEVGSRNWTGKKNWAPRGYPNNGQGASHPLHNQSLKNDRDCTLISYGVKDNYTFEAALEKDFGCHGVAFDPTSEYAETTLPGTKISFHKAAAPTRAVTPEWTITSPVAAANMSNMKHVSVLKMDCEGCEYALADSLKKEDDTFFAKVDQFTAEFHFNNRLLHTATDMKGLEQLLSLLYDAQFKQIEFGDITPCNYCPGNCYYYGRMAAEAWASTDGVNVSAVEEAWDPFCFEGLKQVGHMCGINCVNVLFTRIGD